MCRARVLGLLVLTTLGCLLYFPTALALSWFYAHWKTEQAYQAEHPEVFLTAAPAAPALSASIVRPADNPQQLSAAKPSSRVSVAQRQARVTDAQVAAWRKRVRGGKLKRRHNKQQRPATQQPAEGATTGESFRVVTYFSGAMCDFWRNLMATVRAANLADHTVSYLLDDGATSCAASGPATGELLVAADVLRQPTNGLLESTKGGVGTVVDEDRGATIGTASGLMTSTDSANWGSRAFREVTTLKLRLVLMELARMPQAMAHLLYLDVDVVLMRNVLPELLALPPRDVYLQVPMS